MRPNALLSRPLVIAAALAATSACAWAGLSSYTGRSVERSLNQQYDKLAELPFVKVRERHYERSLTAATGEVTLAIGWPDRKLAGKAGGKAGFELKVRHRISHGPFTRDGLAAARIDTELVVPESIRAEVAALFSDRVPLAASTRVGFGGDTRSTVEIAPMKIDDAVVADLQRRKGAAYGWEQGARFEWQGMTFTSALSADQAQMHYEGRVGPLTVSAPDGTRIETSDARFEGKGKRIDGWLYDDDGTMKMQSISVQAAKPGGDGTTAVRLSDIVTHSSTTFTDGFLGQKQRMHFGSLKVGDREIGSLDYDTSIDRLHLKTLTDGVKAVLAKRPFDCVGMDDGQISACIEPAIEEARPVLFALLKHAPRIAVDRFALTVPEGEARIDYALSLDAIEQADFDSPEQLLGKIGVTANASFGEAVIGRFIAMAMAQSGRGDAPSPEQLASMVTEGAKPLVAQGFVRQAGGKLSTSLEMKNGSLKINGKVIDPALTASAIGALAQADRSGARTRRR